VKEAIRLRPDIIVADISMPFLNGIEAVSQIREIEDRIKVIFLTMHPDVSYAMKAFEVGASGYVIKSSASRELIAAIKDVMMGKTYVTPQLAGELMKAHQKAQHGEDEFIRKLTKRQKEILKLIADGHLAKEIADILSISTRTVERHKYNMLQDLNLKTTADLIKYAIKHGIAVI
jgi:DNA-binding NarL/FixJ family response regulator